jgi:sugar lactone lactonase YvrE
MLRFAPDGHLQARWALPDDYQWPSGCVAVSRDRVYLADARGAVLVFSVDGKPLDRWSLPEPIGSLTVSPDGARIYALSATHLLTLSAKGDDLKSWDLAGPSAGIATLPTGRVLVGDHLYSRVDVFCADGSLCGQIGEAGRWPGQFDRMGDLTADRDGRLYISDYGHRAVQRFTPSGHITALYWSVEDDEHE